MANTLFVSYDLRKPGRDYSQVEAAIKSQATWWAHVQQSLWFVKTSLGSSELAAHVWKHMDANDRLIVIDVRNNTAYWYNLDPEVAKGLIDHWHS